MLKGLPVKFVLLSDFHITNKNPPGRKDNIQSVWKKKLSFILEYAQRNEAVILQAGDLFDTPRDWQVLFDMIILLKKYNVELLTIYGQHNMYLRADVKKTPTTLGVLERLGLLKVLSNLKPLSIGKFLTWGCSWKQKVPKPTTLNEILVVHESISDSALWSSQDFTSADYFLRKNPFRLVLAGDIHKRFFIEKYGGIICNTGPILRLAATEYNMEHKPGFFIYDGVDNFERIKIPCEPAEEVFDRTYLKENKQTKDITDQFVESLKTLPDTRESHGTIKELILKYIKDNKIEEDVKDFLSEVIKEDAAN